MKANNRLNNPNTLAVKSKPALTQKREGLGCTGDHATRHHGFHINSVIEKSIEFQGANIINEHKPEPNKELNTLFC
jgi:hypothetical protein